MRDFRLPLRSGWELRNSLRNDPEEHHYTMCTKLSCHSMAFYGPVVKFPIDCRSYLNDIHMTKSQICNSWSRLHLKCDGTRAETRFRLSEKRTSPFKPTGASVQSTTGSRVVRISGSNGSNAGYTMFRGGVKSIGYPLHSPVSPSLPLPCVTVCHHISSGLYQFTCRVQNFCMHCRFLSWIFWYCLEASVSVTVFSGGKN
jgi:hypothetical protein